MNELLQSLSERGLIQRTQKDSKQLTSEFRVFEIADLPTMQQSTRTSILKERNSNSSHNVIKLAGDEIVRASHDESISCRSNNSDQKSPKNGHQYSELTTSTVTSDGLIRALTTRTFTMPELKITVRPREAQNNGNMPSFL